eukprot:TRINITY_DN7714_c0_g1_i10.p2 TRINITY_DN7714_c0_g1~~TRINITY_DN7714_c0_g1_i10.p2  ORF type:complete len:104 (-),score=9.56 TRINITY_DN7714_c0_g1_i10:62-373(-)
MIERELREDKIKQIARMRDVWRCEREKAELFANDTDKIAQKLIQAYKKYQRIDLSSITRYQSECIFFIHETCLHVQIRKLVNDKPYIFITLQNSLSNLSLIHI